MEPWGYLKSLTPTYPNVLLTTSVTTIGRNNKVCKLTDPNFSSRHCKIERETIGKEAIFKLEDLSTNGTYLNKRHIQKGESVVLRVYDEITLLDPKAMKDKCVTYTFIDNDFERKEIELGGAQTKYDFLEFLGKGNFGVVKKVRNIETGKICAMKIIDISSAREKGEDNLIRRECDILRQVDHPSIIKLYDVFETRMYVYIVMEYIGGGNLFQAIILSHKHYEDTRKQEVTTLENTLKATTDPAMKQKLQNSLGEIIRDINETGFSEEVTLLIMKQVLEALVYLHAKGIIHRDLKLENVMWTGSGYEIRVSDFGLGRTVGKNSRAETICGTQIFTPPELYSGKTYDGTKMDVYSCGVMVYMMLTSQFPFDMKMQSSELVQKIIKGEFIPRAKFTKVSPEVVDLMQNMLLGNPEKRFSAAQCLQHEIFTRKH
ncbi:hypothetical protein EIN_186790 [Entamoeba invadens IP1]|uniref:hypothetical protein n=1 Tax=Entamoeba invadens IP1 TaxID=370355 RepID=UPI0002C3E0D1|nr:hypothetical protein EIN_186790 [Entamoeba invadens IP1]ELP94242.1 hypothetical protein EIN_186790 [Entamoeba invadens IP1]|eukprot:XP_004261013.1 hypothetical protein EIN_186790 [Entamoeba invadens IP1]